MWAAMGGHLEMVQRILKEDPLSGVLSNRFIFHRLYDARICIFRLCACILQLFVAERG